MEESKAEESRFNASDRLRLKAHDVSENGSASFFRWRRKKETAVLVGLLEGARFNDAHHQHLYFYRITLV
jgi:hypothetical protein